MEKLVATVVKEAEERMEVLRAGVEAEEAEEAEVVVMVAECSWWRSKSILSCSCTLCRSRARPSLHGCTAGSHAPRTQQLPRDTWHFQGLCLSVAPSHR